MIKKETGDNGSKSDRWKRRWNCLMIMAVVVDGNPKIEEDETFNCLGIHLTFSTITPEKLKQ